MKKTLAAVLVVCVIAAAGAAFAQPKNVQDFGNREHRNQQELYHPDMMNLQGQPGEYCRPYGNCSRNGGRFEGRGPRHGGSFGFGGHYGLTQDMPKEIRDKAVELAKLRVDLREAMSSNPIDKAKALDVHAKIQKLGQDIEAWRFARKLERIEEFRKQMELNKNVPPASTQN